MKIHTALAAALVSLILPSVSFGGGGVPERILLWPEGAPEAKGTEPKDQPWMDLYLPEKAAANGCAVVVCPGGGYGGLADDHEGIQPARFYNSLGVTAYVLHYRLGGNGYKHPIPWHDAQRALRLVRTRAEKDGIDPGRLGIMGFSAGGHLAGTAGTHFDTGNSAAPDPVDRAGSRPDFQVLCYGVLSFDPAITHGGSVNNLLGDRKGDPELLKFLSAEQNVTPQTPPAFLFHTDGDAAVPAENSLRFYTALRKERIPSELHVYQNGVHGVGLMPGDPVLGTWPGHLRAWLRDNQWLRRGARAAVRGKLTVNGAPVSWGAVTFTPEDPSLAVTTARVRNGDFQLDANSGPVTGSSKLTFTFSAADVPNAPSGDGFHTAASLTKDGAQPVTLTLTAENAPLALDIKW